MTTNGGIQQTFGGRRLHSGWLTWTKTMATNYRNPNIVDQSKVM